MSGSVRKAKLDAAPLAEALQQIVEIAPATSVEAELISAISPESSAEQRTWRGTLRDAQRIAIVALREQGEKV